MLRDAVCFATVVLEGSAVEVCDETTCKYGGTCEYDAEGSHGCVCNFNCEAIRFVLTYYHIILPLYLLDLLCCHQNVAILVSLWGSCHYE